MTNFRSFRIFDVVDPQCTPIIIQYKSSCCHIHAAPESCGVAAKCFDPFPLSRQVLLL